MRVLIVAFALLLLPIGEQGSSYAAGGGFPDVTPAHRYYDAIAYAHGDGIVQGYEDGSFHPDKVLNRAEFTKMIISARFTSREIEDCIALSTAKDRFPDIYYAFWYGKYVCLAKSWGIVGGYPDGTFRPERTISYAEAAKIVVGAYGLKTKSGKGAWYIPYHAVLEAARVVPPTVRTFSQAVTRGELASLLYGLKEEGREKQEVQKPGAHLIVLDASTFDFGEINALDGRVEHTFVLQNVGSDGLLFKGGSTACDCLKVTFAFDDGTKRTFAAENDRRWSKIVMGSEKFTARVVYDPLTFGLEAAVGSFTRRVQLMSASSTKTPDLVVTMTVEGR